MDGITIGTGVSPVPGALTSGVGGGAGGRGLGASTASCCCCCCCCCCIADVNELCKAGMCELGGVGAGEVDDVGVTVVTC